MAIEITTTSSSGYLKDRANAIYPAFVDNMPYESWSLTEKHAFFQLKATGGTYYQWSLVSGKLPDGLKLSSNGKISGTPLKEGEFKFTVKVVSGSYSVTKPLVLIAYPYRAKWHSEAKFGAFLNLGPYQYPVKYTKEGIAEFEARVVNFNAVTWAKQLKALGVKILNYSAFAADSVRLWPSTTPTQKELKTKRNFLQELIDACHAQNIKLMVYFAPDSIYNDPVDENGKKIPGKSGVDADPSNKSGWGTRNVGLITELSLMNHDGYWLDVGATDPALYPKGAVEPDFFRWETLAPIMRHNNPWHIIGVNPGTAAIGNMWQYPLIDYTIFEGRGNTMLETTLVDAVPYAGKKKMSIETVNILDSTFTFQSAGQKPNPHHKPAAMIIRSIKRNWKAGATYMLNWPTLADGTMISPVYADTLKKIGEFVKADHTVKSIKPLVSNARTAAASQAKIGLVSLLKAPIKDHIMVKEVNNYYRGMVFVVGENPIEVYQIGRSKTKITENKDIVIKKYWNNYPVLQATLKINAETDSDGYQYNDVGPLTLTAGMVYYIGIKESPDDDYTSNNFSKIPKTDHIRIVGNMILNPNADISPVKKDNLGQYINLKYKVLPKTTGDIALGKPIQFLNHNPPYNELKTNAVVYYPFNLNDGEPESAGQPSGDYQFLTVIDLMYVRKVSRVVVKFYGQGFATEMKLTTGLTKTEFKEAATIKNNSNKAITYLIEPVDAQFVHLWVIKPDGPNQKGSGITISSIEVY